MRCATRGESWPVWTPPVPPLRKTREEEARTLWLSGSCARLGLLARGFSGAARRECASVRSSQMRDTTCDAEAATRAEVTGASNGSVRRRLNRPGRCAVRGGVQRGQDHERSEHTCQQRPCGKRALSPCPVPLQVEAAQPCRHLVVVARCDVLCPSRDVRHRRSVFLRVSHVGRAVRRSRAAGACAGRPNSAGTAAIRHPAQWAGSPSGQRRPRGSCGTRLGGGARAGSVRTTNGQRSALENELLGAHASSAARGRGARVTLRSSSPTGGQPASYRAPKLAAWKCRRRLGFRSSQSSSCWRRPPPSLMRWCRARTGRTPAARLRCY